MKAKQAKRRKLAINASNIYILLKSDSHYRQRLEIRADLAIKSYKIRLSRRISWYFIEKNESGTEIGNSL
ncbi:hypothetical protein [Streptococcus cristatus]|uniref:hypothetical protein n=1 Tax=Streptococcus cristatus TaxID=45634 RepID=UPI001C8CDCFA|nr:hypothetical protein [Streptococcus cristatus]